MKRYWFGGLLVGSLLACGGKTGTDGDDTGGGDSSTVDQDGDGSTADVDCDDSDSTTYPGAEELCDGLDNDCDNEVDEEQFEMFADSDGDGFGDDSSSVMDCALRSGHVEIGGDCDDANSLVYPGALEVCDGLDNDCDSATSELGLVERTAADGTVSDVSDWFNGSAGSPESVSLSSPDERFSFCEGTYYAHIEITAPGVVLEGQVGKAETTILDGAGLDTVVFIAGDGTSTVVADLTIQNGDAQSNPIFSGERLGGGIACFGYTELESDTPPLGSFGDLQLVGLIVQDNEAVYGGGLLTQQCHTTIEESVFRGNSADIAAGIYLAEGNGDLVDVVVEGHENISGTSALLHEGWEDSWNAIWEDVVVQDNTSLDTSGSGRAVELRDVDLLWFSSGSTNRSRLWNNRGNGSGHAMYVRGALQVDDVDLGDPGSGNDNDTVDLFHYEAGSDYASGDSSSFSCTDNDVGCGAPQITAYGDWYQSNTSTEGFFGHVIQVTSRTTLRDFTLGFANSSCSTKTPYVLQRSSVSNGATQSWEVVWQGYNASFSDFKLQSGRVGEVLEPGEYYALVFGFDCGTSSGGINMARSGSIGTDLGFGTSAGAVTKLGTHSYLSVGQSLTMSYAAEDDFNMTVELVALD